MTQSIIKISLFFLVAGIPLLVNPFAVNAAELIKRESAYVLVCLIAACALAAPQKKSLRFSALPIGLPLFLFVLSACIATAFSINPVFSLRGDFARGESFFTIITYAALTVIFAFFIHTREQARGLIRALCITTAAISLYGIVEFLCLQAFGISPLQHLRPPEMRAPFISATMGNANFLGRFLVLVLPLFAANAAIAAGPRRTLLWAGGGVLAFTTLVLTYSRASMAGLAVGGLVFVVLAHTTGRSLKRLIPLLAAGIVMIAVIGMLSNALSGGSRSNFFATVADRIISACDVRESDGLGTRLFTWQRSVPVILERPWFGHGPDTGFDALIQVNFEKAARFNSFTILDRIHNNYLDIALTQGLIGLGAYLAIVIIFMLELLKALRARDTDPDTRMLMCGLFSGFAGCLVNDFFTFSTVSVSMTFWSLIGIGCALQSFHLHHETHGHDS